MKAACFSVAAIDYFPQQQQHFAGGNALNQCVRMSSCGVQCSFVGALGLDEFGERILALLKNHDVDTSFVDRIVGATASNRIVNDETGERFGEDGAWDGGVFEKYRIPEEIWLAIQEHDIWATHASCPNFDTALVKKKHNRLCVDYLHLPDFSVLQETAKYVDIAYAGCDESMIDGFATLSETIATPLVLTLAEKGSVCFLNGRSYKQQALPSDVTDTTGCGDAFQAGFTSEYLLSGNIEVALKKGAEMGRLATQHYGGVPWS
jgi:fructoselysine 6-kinase